MVRRPHATPADQGRSGSRYRQITTPRRPVHVVAGPADVPRWAHMAMREERKVVTALFADLVGSTALGERLDPEEVKLVVGEAVARIVHAVEDFGGTVKDLAGDGVLALFGAPIAHEDDAERAVRAGLRIVDDIGVYARRGGRGVGRRRASAVRVGVDTGPVVLGPIGSGAAASSTRRSATRSTPRPGCSRPPSRARCWSARPPSRVIEPLFEWGPGRGWRSRARPSPVGPAGGAATGDGRDGPRPGRACSASLVGRDRELAVAGDAHARRPGRAGRHPADHRRGRHRQEPAGRRRPGPVRGVGRPRGDPALARGPVRLLRRVAALLAVPRPASATGSASGPTSPSCASGWRCAAPLDGLFGDRAGRDLPVPGRDARAVARARGRRRAWPSSPPRPSSTARSRWSAPSCSDWPRTARWWPASRTCTGPTPRRSSSSSGSCRSPRRQPSCSC